MIVRALLVALALLSALAASARDVELSLQPEASPAPEVAASAPRDPFAPVASPDLAPGASVASLDQAGHAELLLTGLVASRAGRACLLTGGAGGRTFLAREGDRLRDGRVERIDLARNAVVLRVEDPRALKTWRDIELRLPSE